MERARDDAPVEVADRERRRHVRAAVVQGDDPQARVREEDVEVVERDPAHGPGGQLDGRDGWTERRAGGAERLEPRRVGEHGGHAPMVAPGHGTARSSWTTGPSLEERGVS